MPLIPQQDIIKISGLTESIEELVKSELDKYPPVRIISASVITGSLHSTNLLLVVETI